MTCVFQRYEWLEFVVALEIDDSISVGQICLELGL